MSVHQSETTARPEVHGPPKERATTAHSPGTAKHASSQREKHPSAEVAAPDAFDDRRIAVILGASDRGISFH
ncbi:MAG: hypothetical protein ACYDEP_10890 [Acidimicrobiales bacterium]